MSGSINLNRFPTALRVAIKEALESGWTWKKGGSGGLKMRSPKGTQWMHISPGSNIPDEVVKNLRTKMNRALIDEASDDIVAAANDPQEFRVTTTCTVCFTEFLSLDGFAAHQEGCHERAAAALEAEEEADKAITQPEEERPAEGLPGYNNSANLPTPNHRPDLPEASDSGKMSNKEEVVVNGGKRGNYRKRQLVQEGLARALYRAMLTRRQYKNEALSTYANALAQIIDEEGFEYAALDDSESKLAQIFDVLGIDPSMVDKVEELTSANTKLSEDLEAIKGLINGL